MRQLACEMCGSTDVIKQEGLFVCQVCKTKYSVEEARKMMMSDEVQHAQTEVTVKTPEPVIEKEVSAEVKVENETRLESAWKEYLDGNYTMAKVLLVEVLSAEPNNRKAILYKSYAEARLGTVENPNMEIAVNVFKKIVQELKEESADGYEYTEKCMEILTEVKKIAAIKLAEYQTFDREQQKKVQDEVRVARDEMGRSEYYLYANPTFARTLRENGEKHNQLAKEIDQNRITIYNAGCHQITNAMSDLLLEVMGKLENSIYVCDGFYDLLKMYTATYKSYMVSKEDADKYNGIIRFCSSACNEYEAYKKKVQQEKNVQYWEEHAEERDALIDEIAKIDEEIARIQSEIERIGGKNDQKIEDLRKQRNQRLPAEEAKERARQNIRELEMEKSSLSIFQGARKNAIQDEIDTEIIKISQYDKTIEEERKELSDIVNARIKQIREEVAPLHERCAILQKRRDEINEELSANH